MRVFDEDTLAARLHEVDKRLYDKGRGRLVVNQAGRVRPHYYPFLPSRYPLREWTGSGWKVIEAWVSSVASSATVCSGR